MVRGQTALSDDFCGITRGTHPFVGWILGSEDRSPTLKDDDYRFLQDAAEGLSDKLVAAQSAAEELTQHLSAAALWTGWGTCETTLALNRELEFMDTRAQAVIKAIAAAKAAAGASAATATQGGVVFRDYTGSAAASGEAASSPAEGGKASKAAPATVASMQAKALAHSRGQVDLTVPPPPVPQTVSNWQSVRSPNASLARAMVEKEADWKRIRRVAENISKPEYQLREFFDDCIASFPELALFFEGPSAVQREKFLATSSGRSGEAEYQRTIGALFTVYWMLRLDPGGDGRSGICYGVDETWSAYPAPPLPNDQMTAEEKKRASFFHDMEWQQFDDLVERAGCSPQVLGSTDRIIALLCLTAFHDIMKVPTLQPIVQPEHAPYNGFEAGVRIHDHDVALGYILECFPALLPSFDGLPPDMKQAVLFTQTKLQFNHGWFVQAEAPPGGMLTKFKEVLESGANQKDIDLYFVHWVTDLAGAEATPLGGAEKLVIKFPHHVLASFLSSMPYLSTLKHTGEAALVEEYLVARWEALLPDLPVPDDTYSIALMRAVVMAQCPTPSTLVDAFRALPVASQACLATELSRTGCEGQVFKRHAVTGGPAFLVYYSPALLQRSNKDQGLLESALSCLCVVLRAARALWPMQPRGAGSTVIVQVGELKCRDIVDVIRDPGGEVRTSWLLVRTSTQEGQVRLCKPAEINALLLDGTNFRALDFSKSHQEDGPGASSSIPTSPILLRTMARKRTITSTAPLHGSDAAAHRILVFTDMSTECDDECALLWIISKLNLLETDATVDLVQTDSHVRFQWMAHIFGDKFAPGGDWQLSEDGCSFKAGSVQVNMYLAPSPSQEDRIIGDIQRKAPHVSLELEEENGLKKAVWTNCILGGQNYNEVPGGRLDSIVVAAALYEVGPEFFTRFTSCKVAYVVGTPGGINCPMPSWAGVLGGLHKLCAVLYLTPQLTRSVRFPGQYVRTNPHWNEEIRQTVWDATLTFMARRPEMPPVFGPWGLVLRLNVANAMFCRDWFFDVMGSKVEDAPVSPKLVRWVQAYVDRNSGDDRQQGPVLDELNGLGVDITPWGLGLSKMDLAEDQGLTSGVAKEAIRARYRQKLFEQTMLCVVTAEALLFNSGNNQAVTVDSEGVEKVVPRCGYARPEESLSDVFGADEGIRLLKKMPLRWLTPAYDVVAMILAEASLREGTDIDGGLGLLMAESDDSMGLSLLTEEHRVASEHPVLMTLPQMGEGIYRVGPFT